MGEKTPWGAVTAGRDFLSFSAQNPREPRTPECQVPRVEVTAGRSFLPCGAPNFGQPDANMPSWTPPHQRDPHGGYKLMVGSVPPSLADRVFPLDVQTLTD